MQASGDRSRVDLLRGTLDVIVLRTLATMGPQHAYGIADRIEQAADRSIQLNHDAVSGARAAGTARLDQGDLADDRRRSATNDERRA